MMLFLCYNRNRLNSIIWKEKTMTKSNKDNTIKLNNGYELVELLKEQSFEEKASIVSLVENGTSEFPNITDESIKDNSDFMVNLFDSNISNDNSKTLCKKI